MEQQKNLSWFILARVSRLQDALRQNGVGSIDFDPNGLVIDIDLARVPLYIHGDIAVLIIINVSFGCSLEV